MIKSTLFAGAAVLAMSTGHSYSRTQARKHAKILPKR